MSLSRALFLARRGVTILGVLLTILVVTSRAFAQAPPPAPPPPADAAQPAAEAPADPAAADLEKKRAEAKERFLRGVDLGSQDDWDAALVEFLASRELFPTRAALTNAALSYQNLKRYAEAVEMYNELVSKFGDSLPPDERKRVDAKLAELRAFVGEIDVESDQPGSTVVIDGVQRGTTPLGAPLMVNAGTHSVRVAHEGFETFEMQLQVAGKQRKLVQAKLKRPARSGVISVREASGKTLDVVVDGAVVGQTPWQGTVAIGTHSVALRGEGFIGSLPGSAVVKDNETTLVTLVAANLDARVRVEPLPPTARVDVDGVNVGAGVWEGRLTSGKHRIEVYAEGHVPQQREVDLPSGKQTVVKVELDRDLSNPMWATGRSAHLFVEVIGGLALAPSFDSGANAACRQQVTLSDGTSVEGCTDETIPLGFIAGARGGYQLVNGLGLEVFVGYLSLSESLTRNIVAAGDWGAVESRGATDDTKVSGPLGALSVSYQFLEKTPLVFRLWGGAMRARVDHDLKGTFSGPDDLGNAVTQEVEVFEPATNVWVPFVGPEVRFGYRINKRFALDAGVAALFFFGPADLRIGGNQASGPERLTSPENLATGAIQFEPEESIGTFVGFLPTVGFRVDL